MNAQLHDEKCFCDACQIDREFNSMMTEMPESPSMGRRLLGAIAETLAWLSLVGFVALMVRCGNGG